MDFAISSRAAEGRPRWIGIIVKSISAHKDLSRLWDRLDGTRKEIRYT